MTRGNLLYIPLGRATLEETFLHVFLAKCVLIVNFLGDFEFFWVLLGYFGLLWVPLGSLQFLRAYKYILGDLMFFLGFYRVPKDSIRFFKGVSFWCFLF